MARKISRRDFMKISGTAVAAGAAGALTSCKPRVAQTDCESDGKYSWETPPDPIPAGEIKETIESDIVVIGAGIGGLPAAMRAAELGASVQVLEKSNTYGEPRGGWFAIGDKLTEEAGIVVDRDEVLRDMMAQTMGINTRQSLYALYVDNSGEFSDWLVDILAAEGLKTVVLGGEPGKRGYWMDYSCLVHFPVPFTEPPVTDWTGPMARFAEKHGAVFNYNTPAKQLIREDGGRVTGVVAQNSNGDYIQFNAKKGVILSPGGYGRDPEMLSKYFPAGNDVAWNYCNPSNTGDGIKMGMWVGAEMDYQGSACLFSGATVPSQSLWPEDSHSFGWPFAPAVATMPMLWVDKGGNRCINESLNFFAAPLSIANLPGNMVWGVWDSAWESKVPGPWMSFFTPGNTQEQVEKDIESGITFKADTIDELIEKMGVDADSFKATLARYNQLCAEKKDPDFLKDAAWMTSIDTPPYYAAASGTNMCNTFGGLKVSDRMVALDKECLEIPGLYVGGNCASFYGANYPFGFSGSLCGHIMTLGYLTGEYALE